MRSMRRGLSGVFYFDPITAPGSGSPAGAAVQLAPIRVPATAGANGRRMSYEEAAAQDLLRRNQTAAGTNHALGKQGVIPSNIFSNDRVKVEKAPWIDPPASAQSYSHDHIENAQPAQVLLPAIGAQVVVVQFRVPQRRNGVIKWIANEFIGGAAWQGTGALVWQILADGVPIQNYEAIVSSFGTAAAPGVRAPILISESQLIQLILKNVSILPGGQVLTGLLAGWNYPIESEPPGGSWAT